MPTGRTAMLLRLLTLLLASVGSAPLLAAADEFASAGYRLRGLHPASVGPTRALPASPGSAIGASGISLGQPHPVAPQGSSVDLGSNLPGFWPLVAGDVPNLDGDGDGVQRFRDDDDDDDGLPDASETRTGLFVSPGDAGSHPLDADSDDDGFGDGVEVSAGSDPNDPSSVPTSSVPMLGPVAVLVLVGLLLVAPLRHRRSRHVAP